MEDFELSLVLAKVVRHPDRVGHGAQPVLQTQPGTAEGKLGLAAVQYHTLSELEMTKMVYG